HDRGIFTARPEAIKKNCAVVAGLGRPFRFSNMNRHKQQTRQTRKKEITAMKTIITPHRLLLTILRSRSTFILIALALSAFALGQTAQAVSPPPDGGYAGGNTAEGQNALLNLTTSGFNTAVGFLSLRSDTTGQFNTAIGAGTLFANTG